MSEIFISIQLNLIKGDHVVSLFDNIEKTAINISSIEVIVHTDKSDELTTRVVQDESKKRKFKIKCISTDSVRTYGTLWKPFNLLFKETNKNAYFILNTSDEIKFVTYGWDKKLKKYKNYYQDDIFRLRCSKYKYRNYFDFWECGFAPDGISFYTKKWMELCGDRNPCIDPDSFQQSIAYYLYTSDKFSSDQINRDIAINDIEISGEVTVAKYNDNIKKYRQLLINTRAWFVLMSHEMQEEAKRISMRLKVEILLKKDLKKYSYIENFIEKKFIVLDESNKKLIMEIDYRLSKFLIFIKNSYRIFSFKYYSGGVIFKNNGIASFFIYIASRLKNGEHILHFFLNIYSVINLSIEFFINKVSSLLPSIETRNHKAYVDIFLNLKNQKISELLFSDSSTIDTYDNNIRPYLSIHLSTNRIDNLIELINNIENTVENIHDIELIIHVDKSDYKIINYLESYKNSGNLLIKYFASDLVTDFKYLYKAYNPLISLTSKSVKFISLISDEIRFKTPGWDKIILGYSNYYQDGIFRLKLSKYKYFNYNDEWECGFAPDSLAFYSRDWIFLQGMWNPCTGPDSFQSLVSFYMMRAVEFTHTQYCRDIVDPFLLFSGEGASIGLVGDAKRKRIADNNYDWFKLFSFNNLSIAKRNACILIAFIEYKKIISYSNYLELRILDDGCYIYIVDGQKIKFKIYYKLSYAMTIFKIITRAPLIHYYAGGGKSVIKKNPLNGLRMMAMTYAPRIEGLLGGKIQ